MKEHQEGSNSGWTVSTLKEYVIRLYDEHGHRHERTELHMNQLREAQRDALNIAILSVERLIQAAVDNNREALLKAEAANDKRFDSVNEFRTVLGAQQATYITRLEHDGVVQRLTERIQDLTDRVNMSSGKGVGLNAGWQYLVAFIGVISALFAIWIAVMRH